MIIYILTETDHDGFEWKRGFYQKRENAERTLENIVKSYEQMGHPLKKENAQAGDEIFKNDFAIIRLTFVKTRD